LYRKEKIKTKFSDKTQKQHKKDTKKNEIYVINIT